MTGKLALMRAAGVVMAFALLAGLAHAGQYKTLSTEDLKPGQSVRVTSSPKGHGTATEIDVYEFTTHKKETGSYNCNILTNSTGQELNLRLIGANGIVVASCAAPVDGTCSTGPHFFVPDTKFLCIVATSYPNPVVGGLPIYRFSVSRELPVSTPAAHGRGAGPDGVVRP